MSGAHALWINWESVLPHTQSVYCNFFQKKPEMNMLFIRLSDNSRSLKITCSSRSALPQKGRAYNSLTFSIKVDSASTSFWETRRFASRNKQSAFNCTVHYDQIKKFLTENCLYVMFVQSGVQANLKCLKRKNTNTIEIR